MPTLRRVGRLEGGGYRVVQPDVVVSQEIAADATTGRGGDTTSVAVAAAAASFGDGPASVGPAGDLLPPDRRVSPDAADMPRHRLMQPDVAVSQADADAKNGEASASIPESAASTTATDSGASWYGSDTSVRVRQASGSPDDTATGRAASPTPTDSGSSWSCSDTSVQPTGLAATKRVRESAGTAASRSRGHGNRNDELWNVRFKQLKQYKVDHGDCNVPKGWKGNKSKLAGWVTTQRSQYRLLKQSKQSSMTVERIEKLERIGFEWFLFSRVPGVDWDYRFQQLKQYKVDHGDCNVPRGWKGNKQLAAWVSNQRREYLYLKQCKPSQMTEQRRTKLTGIGFEWSLRFWDHRLIELKQYKVDHGNCNVPQGFKGNKQLASWVTTQRSQYRLLRQGKPSQLKQERIRKLESVGFEWSLRVSPNVSGMDWDYRFQELKQYKVDRGDCNVPKGWKGNKKLAGWVHRQRSQHRYLKQNEHSAMTEERIEKLESIGFEWFLRRRT